MANFWRQCKTVVFFANAFKRSLMTGLEPVSKRCVRLGWRSAIAPQQSAIGPFNDFSEKNPTVLQSITSCRDAVLFT